MTAEASTTFLFIIGTARQINLLVSPIPEHYKTATAYQVRPEGVRSNTKSYEASWLEHITESGGRERISRCEPL